MPTYKTPDVYVEEISIFPPSVAEVETAIPAFVGYTEKAELNGKEIFNTPLKIGSMLEYEMYFGGAPEPKSINVELDSNNSVKSVEITPLLYLYDCLRMFYANGGGDCYIVSVGKYPSSGSVDKDELVDGLETLKKEDEPTLLVIPDSVLLTATKLGDVHKEMLDQCNTLQDRFAVLDIKDGDTEISATSDPVETFRDNVGINYLKYGASYYPWLRSSLSFDYSYENIKDNITKNSSTISLASVSADTTIIDQLNKVLADKTTTYDFMYDDSTFEPSISEGYADVMDSHSSELLTKQELVRLSTFIKNMLTGFVALNTNLTDDDTGSTIDAKTVNELHDELIADGSKLEDYAELLIQYDMSFPDETDPTTADALGVTATSDFSAITFDTISADVSLYGTGTTVADWVKKGRQLFQELYENVLSYIEDFYTNILTRAENLEINLKDTNSVYAAIVEAISEKGIELPPSGAVVGIFAAVDNDRGVWKAPANVSLSYVIGPSVKLTNKDQEDLNVDTTAGKSVNAIRFFTGKGTLIWGARTLAGNDNEWRYVPVRRFFNMVEESVKKSTYWAVFEPNDANTWVKVKSMIENYLTQKWRDGALAGAKPEEAFFVKVGLGTTMTSQDILEGRMNVEIGMAVVRPAEFIILKFSHKLQES